MAKARILGVICLTIWLYAYAHQSVASSGAPSETPPPHTAERMVEWTIKSRKAYVDPFNDVDVDVVFRKDSEIWRVPAFWRGASSWGVRFAPPTPGEYAYRIESTDHQNPDLNGHDGHVTITPYAGNNSLLRHGMLRVSGNKRYFEQSDGTPFYWLGDTWWSGLSTRLSWEDFQKLTADRKARGFTVVQIVAGLVPPEEQAPSDPGYCNEGGCVWEAGYKQINPNFFDYADRRLQHLIDAGIVPAVVGAWSEKLAEMGLERLKKHWRYIIARYGAYPAFWVIGGEVFDPPEELARKYLADGRGSDFDMAHLGGWTALGRYIRKVDPIHHPVTVHENPEADDLPLQEESVTDFQLFQPSHFGGWASIHVEIAQLDTHYSRTMITKPLVVGEIGYEGLGETHLEDFQRTAFWLGMLNGAAGYTYGANGTWESYSNDKPFQRLKWSLTTWEEGMNLPGSRQIGLGARLLQQHPWWKFEPHPEWITPAGTTLFERRGGINQFHVDVSEDTGDTDGMGFGLRESEWQRRHGEFQLPYAAGIPKEVRFIYIPYFGFMPHVPPTVLGLESNVSYHAYFWEPSSGVRFDLGTIVRPQPGAVIRGNASENTRNTDWTDYEKETSLQHRALIAKGDVLTILHGVTEENVVASARVRAKTNASVVLRFHDIKNYIAAVYAPGEDAIYVVDRKDGVNSKPLGKTKFSKIGSDLSLNAEVSGGWAIVSITDAQHTYTSQIVSVSNLTAGGAGVLHAEDGSTQMFEDFTVRRGHPPIRQEGLERRLIDARGHYRGYVGGSGSPILSSYAISSWDDFGTENPVLLDAYRPDRLPYGRDWVLILEREAKTDGQGSP